MGEDRLMLFWSTVMVIGVWLFVQVVRWNEGQ